jgi:hypothetical protein
MMRAPLIHALLHLRAVTARRPINHLVVLADLVPAVVREHEFVGALGVLEVEIDAVPLEHAHEEIEV